MRISVFGLGYVGTVTAACLAAEGNDVIGVDITEEKVNKINSGISPIIEADIGEIIERTAAENLLTATSNYKDAVAGSDIALICVGTPSANNGSLNLQYVERVITQIGNSLKELGKNNFTVVLRSTVLPGTTDSLVIPTLEKTSGRKISNGINVLYNPEFLREGTSVKDFYNPPKTVIGKTKHGQAKILLDIYGSITAPSIVTSLKVA